MENTIIGAILAVAGLAEIYILIYLVASPRSARKTASVRRLEKMNVFLALFFVISLGAFIFMNSAVYADEISFDLSGNAAANQIPNDPTFLFPTSTVINDGGSTTTTGATNVAPGTIPVPPAGQSLQLVIPKLNVSAPIVFPAQPTTQSVLTALQSGVGVYPGSVMPGQPGRMVLLGHSSKASWYHGNYAYVFSLLDKLKVGDQFMIVSGNTKYVYQVFASSNFQTTMENNYLSQTPKGSEVDLSSCWPAGTADARWIVSATLVSTGS